MRIIKLGAPAKDLNSGIDGAAVMLRMDTAGQINYVFQPNKCNKADGTPASHTYPPIGAVKGPEEEVPDLPIDILGQIVKDSDSGYEGRVVSLVLHKSGCIHAEVKTQGLNKNNEPFQAINIDIRNLIGKNMPKFTEAELKADRKAKPSPGMTVGTWRA